VASRLISADYCNVHFLSVLSNLL